jgi:hypothetical protein
MMRDLILDSFGIRLVGNYVLDTFCNTDHTSNNKSSMNLHIRMKARIEEKNILKWSISPRSWASKLSLLDLSSTPSEIPGNVTAVRMSLARINPTSKVIASR